jgi:hypothetical protein
MVVDAYIPHIFFLHFVISVHLHDYSMIGAGYAIYNPQSILIYREVHIVVICSVEVVVAFGGYHWYI